MDDFKPDYSFKEVGKDKPFRVWCQKVLPTIYDDSLSYYELLTKVVYILNETIERVNDLDDNVDELNKAFNQLVLFLNAYKQELDSRMDGFEIRLNEQDSKIDSFVQTMEKYVESYVTKYVDENVTNIVNETFTEYVKTEEFTKIVEVAVESDPSIAGTKDDTEEILAKIGNTNDEGGSAETGSLMAKLNTIINTGGGGGGGGTGTGDAQESSVQKVISRVGVTDDTGATSDSGTVMGKLNDLITSNASQTTTLNTLATNTATNNTASVTGTLSQKLSYIANNLIGATGNTGGSATAGTAMAKLNAIVSNTITNNTANLTGTLSQKLSYIANTLIGATNATGGTTTAGTVNAKLNAILSNQSSGNVAFPTINNNSYNMVVKDNYQYVSGNVIPACCLILNSTKTSAHSYVIFKKPGYILLEIMSSSPSITSGTIIDNNYLKCVSNESSNTDTATIITCGYNYNTSTQSPQNVIFSATSSYSLSSTTIIQSYNNWLGFKGQWLRIDANFCISLAGAYDSVNQLISIGGVYIPD